MYYLYNGHAYVGLDSNNTATCVTNIKKALSFSDEQKAINYLDNLKSTLRRFEWNIFEVNNEVEDDRQDCKTDEDYTYEETELEKSGFNISDFFNDAITILSQLKVYAGNMRYLEKEYDKKILDTRHYKRDKNTKLSAVQLQRLEQFEIQLERERYECKSNRIIAEIFLSDMSRLENVEYLDVVRNVKESEYKPKILTYELLDNVVGKQRKTRRN